MEGKSRMVEERSWVWQFKSLPFNKPNYRVLNVSLKKMSPRDCQCWEKLMDKKLIARRNWWLLVFEKETPRGKKHECLENVELGISVVKKIFWSVVTGFF